MTDNPYLAAVEYRTTHMGEASQDHFKLNELHDAIMNQVIKISINQLSIRSGPPPSPFSIFVMGSAGRLEQSVWSDQDHGIIYHDESNEAKSYFLALGKEISKGLHFAGYPYCDGGVMASNPFWCKSIDEWQLQITNWLSDSTWESTRYLLIFLDGRSILGEGEYVESLKTHLYQTANTEQLLSNSLRNTLHIKKGINLLGQLLTETHGPHSGTLPIKEIAILPYVNALRLIAIKERVMETPTLSRLEKISTAWIPGHDKQFFKEQFLKLLNYRLMYGDHTNYDSGHYLVVKRLTKEQTKEVKEIIKNGYGLFHHVRRLLEKK
ncbi:DUF294 nucleotidyltransferase-like domain-containing protein [Neobacillus sp. OS1-2]|uniref:DUF294 nucleotidyltransferase-like domain-containing protein n=1 Tax=Neobacillus sp. OS1-2 TaxID=3070680 RepID=UPI0027DF9167|nr:DUF294 nucleotidyltransferase-like domain-containing protein [Neobacillus sp. OS1-2]WML38335.1 DUF294 nucleotidyltransferase-like domain-containing protein [Neobacillus sp. OS1-2]